MGFYEEFRDHRQEMRARLIRIEDKIDNHDHAEYWSAYRIVGAVVAIVSVAVGGLAVFG